MPDGERLFFALWPPADVQERVVADTRGFIGTMARPVAARDLHVTLAFLGNSSAAQRGCYEQVANAIQGAPFQLTLDHLGRWPAARVLWLAPSHVPVALSALVQDLNTALSGCGFVPETRAYQPHMTVARNHRQAFTTTGIAPLVWQVDQFVLAVSAAGHASPRYHTVAAWPLAQRKAAGPV